MKKVLLVYSDYYKIISKKMLLEAEKVLKKTFTVNKIRVTGSFEIPFVVSKNIKKYDGFVALGCIIQGQTPHFHFISQSINNGLIKLSIDRLYSCSIINMSYTRYFICFYFTYS